MVKRDEFIAGDLCVYAEIDSVVPERAEFEFLRKKNSGLKPYGCVDNYHRVYVFRRLYFPAM